MSLINKLIRHCFPGEVNTQYTALSKKDDNFGIEEAKNWVATYSIDELERNNFSSLKNINDYANKVIKSLKRIPITSSNVEIVRSHFDQLARRNQLVGQALLERVSQLKAADKKLINLLYNTLNFAAASGIIK